MKTLDLLQMEEVEGGRTFSQCMDSGLSHWQVVLLLGIGGLTTGGAGFYGGMAGMALYCSTYG